MHTTPKRERAMLRSVQLIGTIGLLAVLVACTTTQSGGSQTAAAASPAESAAGSAAGSPAGSAAGGGTTVALEGFAFEPAELTVHVGDTVTFENKDDTRHTATHGENGTAAENAEFDIDLPENGSTGEYTFDEGGDFPVTCKVHPDMNMTITVEE
ncbi:MAG: plastocyanin/azurin family copper-binding protein [Candidatus Limnocylindria bacterium]